MTFHPVGVLAYLYLLLCGLLIYYGIYMLVMTLSFWLVHVENLAVLCDVVFHASRYPIDIFRGIAWRIAVYVVPLAFIASFPVRALFGKLEPGWLVWGTILAIALPFASTLFWRFGLRHYGSASS
jgi:ABC-2 type transport system permease protein